MYIFFFFKQKTAYEMRISDWSSDVCSSDLQPIRVLSVTGTSTAFTTASMISEASFTSRISAEPAQPLTILRTGQPMLMSMIAAPLSAASLAASPISCAVQPTRCIDPGPSSGCHAASWTYWRVSRIAALLAINPVTLSHAPDPSTTEPKEPECG